MSGVLSLLSDQEQDDADESEECTSESTEHELLEHSFSSLQRCHKCNKYLYGIIRQGLQCQGNNLCIIHRQDRSSNTLTTEGKLGKVNDIKPSLNPLLSA